MMQQPATQHAVQHPQKLWSATVGVAAKVAFYSASFMLLLLAPSRDWTWPAAWALFCAPIVLVFIPCLLYLRAFNPDLISERQRFLRNEGTAGFERWIVPIALSSIPARLLAAGWQHRQQLQLQLQQAGERSPAPLLSTPGQLAAAAMLLLSLALQSWSMCANKFFSSVVRIQGDRGHSVCTRGPYAWVRHPGYVGFAVQGIAESVLLQSSWGMGCALFLVVMLAIRTVLEDAFLRTHLPGYAAYSQRVRCRWVPLLW